MNDEIENLTTSETDAQTLLAHLLDGDFFTARNIVTSWKDVLRTTSIASKNEWEDVIYQAEARGYSNVVIVDEWDNPRGYVNVERIRGRPFDEGKIGAIADPFIISASERFPSLASRFSSEYSEGCPLYLVNLGRDKWGIATYADLNRKTGYLYTYALILALEQWIKNTILHDFPPLEGEHSNPEWVDGLKFKDANKLLRDAKAQKECCLSLCYLGQLIRIVNKNKKFEYMKNILPQAVFHHANSIRVRVAHPTKLLVPNSNARSELHSLAQFWEAAEKFVKDYAPGNTKNRNWSRPGY